MTAKNLLYDWAGGNVWLFHVINTQAPSWRDSAMSLATRAGDYWNFPVFLGIWLLVAWQWRRHGDNRAMYVLLQAQRFAAGAVLGLLLTSGLKLGLDFARPIAVLGFGAVRLLARSEAHYSLPSGHSVFVVVLAASLWPLLAWPIRWVLVACVLWVGVSRVWLGEHFPADVLAGYATGLISAFVAARIVGKRDTPVARIRDGPADDAPAPDANAQ